jgi:MFS transporter, OFA family, oxalate/formate antiporter
MTLSYNTMGSLLNPLSLDFGWNLGEIQLALTGFGTVVAIGTVIIGPFCDRFGSRQISIFGMAGFGLTFAALSLSNSLISFYLLYLLLGLMVTGLTAVVFTQTINQWFVLRRGLALGILLSGPGVANLVIPALTVRLISQIGWRGTYVVLGFLSLLICLPLLWAYFYAPGRQVQMKVTESNRPYTGAPYREFVRAPAFWLTCISCIAVGLAYTGAWINLQTILSTRGLDRSLAAVVVGLTGPGIIAGRVATGFLLDKVRASLLAPPLFLLTAVGCFLLGEGYSRMAITIFAVTLLGCSCGAEGDLMPFVIGRYFNVRHYGAAFGMAYAAYQISVAISPTIYGYVFHFSGTYTFALHSSAVLFVVAAISMMLLGPYPSQAPSRGDASWR